MNIIGGLRMKRTFLPRLASRTSALSLLTLEGINAEVARGAEDEMVNFLRATPLFAKNPITLSPDEREKALGWPIIKVYLTTERLILNRTNLESGRTAAFFLHDSGER